MPPSRPDARRRRGSGLRLALLVLAAGAALGMTAPHQPADGGDGLAVMLADGTLAHDNSRDGAAILTASNVWPGWSGSGSVTIGNSGSAGSWLRLAPAGLRDLPGSGGGRLSERLVLQLDDVTIPDFPVPIYAGSIAALGEQWLGRMDPGAARSYRFATTMPSGGDDNAFQASAMDLRFEWTVRDAPPGVDPPGDEPTPVDVPPGNEPTPVDVPPDDPGVVVVPDGPPVVVVNRGRLRLRLAVPPAQRPLKRRSLLAYAACSRACRTTLTGQLGAVGSKAGAVVKVSRALAAGIRTRVTLRLSKRTIDRARRALRRGRVVHGTVVFHARDRTGRTAKAKQRIRLVRAR